MLVDPDGSIKAAGGLIYQLMPGADEEAIAFCEDVAAKQKPVSQLIESGMDLEEMIHTYFPDAQILAHKDVRWHCGCSRESFRASLSTLHDDQLKEMVDDGKGAEIICQFCNSRYFFDSQQIQQIREEKKCGK